MQENKGRIMFFGIVLGAATGLAAALLLTRRAGKGTESTALTAGEGLKLGVMVVGLLRAIASLGDDEPKT